MGREDFEGVAIVAKENHKKRVADNPRRIEYARRAFERHGIKYELKNSETGHFHCYRKKDGKRFEFYAGTGKIKGFEKQRGIKAIIRILERR